MENPNEIVPERKLPIDREQFEDIMKRRFFFSAAFSIYGGVAGLYDYGPPGTAIKANLLNHWRNHFILEEDMLEIDTTSVTPGKVFEVSGHCAKFTDLMCKNEVTKAYYRADHLLEHHIDKLLEDKSLSEERKQELLRIAAQVDDYECEVLGKYLKEFNVRDPEDGGELSDPYPFNLMFETSIGPAGNHKGYLRPETAQGIFLNFPKLLEYNGGHIPFAGATIGSAFRNEISPRAGLLRVREFTLAEIEHFIDPEEDVHPRFNEVEHIVLTLYPRLNQTTTGKMVKMKVGDAVRNKIIGGENLGYFLARTYTFLKDMGALEHALRFRQHLSNEMAFYASDCWDAELLTSYGWIECVGHANRSCYDLSVHAAASKTKMHFFKKFETPQIRQIVLAKPQKSKIGSHFNKEAKLIISYLEHMESDKALCAMAEMEKTKECRLNLEGKEYVLKEEMIQFVKEEQKVSGMNVTPAVIEPSFGIGRIIYCLLEQSYWVRNGDAPHLALTVQQLQQKKETADKANIELMRGVLSLSPLLAPTKVSVIPLFSSNTDMLNYCPLITEQLKKYNISHKVDKASQNIGKRYSRTDELGIPFGITIDFDTIKNEGKQHTITLRDRDSTTQVRVPVSEVALVLHGLISQQTKWDTHVVPKYPKHE